MKKALIIAVILIACYVIFDWQRVADAIRAQGGPGNRAAVTASSPRQAAQRLPHWPTIEKQLGAESVRPGSALEQLIRDNQDFSVLHPQEFSDKLRLPLWLRVWWRKVHPEWKYAPDDPTGGYPLALKEIYEWMLAHQDLQRGPGDATREKEEEERERGLSPDTATISGELRVSGAQSVARSESAISLNFLDPMKIIVGSNNITGGGAQGQYFSTDGGATWGQTTLPFTATDTSHSDPTADWTSDGRAWSTTLGIQSGNLRGRAYVSTNNGAAWTFDGTYSDSTQTQVDKQMTWADRSATSAFKDNLYVIYHNGTPAFMNRRTSGGWQTPIQVSGAESTGTAIGQDVKTNKDGEVFGFWPTTGNARIFVTKSTNGGVSYGTPVQIATTFDTFNIGVPSFASRRALIYVSAGAYKTAVKNLVYAAWTDLSGETGCTAPGNEPGSNVASTCKTRIWFARSTDGGATWLPKVMINNQPGLNDQFNQWLVVDETNGGIGIIYYDTVGDPGRKKVDVWYQYSPNDGAGWNPPQKVTTAQTDETAGGQDSGNQFGDYNNLSGLAGTLFPSWTDRRAGAREEIWTAKITENGVGAPFITNAGATITAGNCGSPATSAIDPGETVTVSFNLQNAGAAGTTNLVATLQATGGVTSPSGPQTYGALAAGGTAVARSFSFTANGICGNTLTATLQLHDGAMNLGTVYFIFNLGGGVFTTFFAENFDSLTAPALPAGWTTSRSGSSPPPFFATTSTLPDTAPNTTFAGATTSVATNDLISPAITFPTGAGIIQLTFRHTFSFEASSSSPGVGFDGGVLELSADSPGFTTFNDVTSALVGGAFVNTVFGSSYTGTISTGFGSPLAGRPAWTGFQGSAFDASYITVTLNLPAALAGQTVKFRWRGAWDSSDANSAPNWRIDGVALKVPSCPTCASCPTISITPPTLTAGTAGAAYSQALAGGGGASPYAFNVTAGALPPGLTLNTNGLLSGTPSQNGSFNFTVTATDANNCTGAQAYTLAINCPTVTVSPPTLPDGTGGTAYSQTITAGGGTSAYSFTLTAGALPNGLALSSGGLLSGTPNVAGTFNFTITATDANGCSGTQGYTLNIAGPPVNYPRAYVTNRNTNNVSVMDTATNTVTATVSVGAFPVGIAVNVAGTRAYVTNYFSSNVSVIDTATNTLVATVAVETQSEGVAVNPAGTRVYVTGESSNNLLVMDTSTNTVMAAVAVGAAPRAVAVNPDGTRIYVANLDSNNVSVIDASTNTVVATVAVGDRPFGMAVNPAGTRVYVTNYLSDNMSVIDTSTNTVAATVAVGDQPTDMAINPAGTRAYIANSGNNNISVMDTSTNTIVATVAVGSASRGVAVNRAGTRAYVVNGDSNNVSVIDTATNAVVATVAVGAAPVGVAVTGFCPTITLSPVTLSNGAVGASYNQTITAMGGNAPYSFAVTAGALPNGLTLTSGGLLSGTPNVDGAFNFTITATDGNGCTGPQAYALTISQSFAVITVNSLADTAIAGDGQCTLREALNNANAGGQTTAGDCNAGAVSTTIAFSVTGVINLSGLLPLINSDVVINGPGASQLDVHRSTGGNYAIFNINSGKTVTLSGLTISNGQLGGIHNSGNLTIAGCVITGNTVSGGAGGGVASSSGTLTITNSTISGNSATGLSVGGGGGISVLSGMLVMSNSTVSGNLAGNQGGGFNLQGGTATLTNCTISGNTAQASGHGGGLYGYGGAMAISLVNCTVTGNTGNSAIRADSSGGGVAVQLKNTLVSANNSPNFATSGANASIVSQGNNLDSDGTSGFTNGVNGNIVGTSGSPINAQLAALANYGGPTGTHLLLCKSPAINAGTSAGAPATDQRGVARPAGAVDIGAVEAHISLSPASLSAGMVDAVYSQTFSASGGVAPYAFSLLSGTLPPGLGLGASGLLSGTPTQTGSFAFTVRATDAGGFAGACSYSVTITANTAPSITPVPVARQAGSPASNSTIATVSDTETAVGALTVNVNGSALSTVNNITVSNLVDTNGTITANVVADCNAVLGVTNFTINVSDGSLTTPGTLQVTVSTNSPPVLTYVNQSVAAGGSLTVNPAIGLGDNGSISTIAVLSQGAYTGTINVNSSGVVSISGAKPGGTHTITIRATDNCGAATDASFTLTVNCQTISLIPPTLPNGTVGTSYNQTVTASGGTPGYSLTVSAGALPTGLSLATGGSLSGTPSAGGAFNFTIRATDANGCQSTQNYSMTINTPPTISAFAISRQQGSPTSNSTIANVSDADQAANTLTVTVNSGASATVNGVTVSGLSVSAGGVVTANVVASCTATSAVFTLAVTDNAGASINTALIATVTTNSAPTLSYGNHSVAVGGSLNVTPSTASDNGSIALFNVQAVTPALTTAPTVNSSGVVSITNANLPGLHTITIRATDNCGTTADASFTVNVGCPTATLNPTTLPDGTGGTAYSQSITATGGAPSYSFAVTAGALPGGLTLTSGGLLSGTPNMAGTFNFTVTATDANGCAGSLGYTVNITARLGAQTRALYVQNECFGCGNQIYGYAVNETTGALTLLAGFPIATGGNGVNYVPVQMLAIDRANLRLYAINRGSDTVSAYSINPTTGALVALPFSPLNLGFSGQWTTIAVHPTGSPLVVGDANGQLLSYQVTATTATAAAGSPYNTGFLARPYSTAFSQDGNYVYTGGNISNNPFAGFSVNATTGVLTALAGSPYDAGNRYPEAYATDVAGRLFMANLDVGQLRVFTTASGIPSAVSGSPFASGLTSASHGVLHPNNFYLVADRGSSRVGVYQISGSGSATTLAPVAGSPFASGGFATDILALNQTGTLLFAANANSHNLTTFSVNTSTGALTSLGVQAANTLGASGWLSGMVYLPLPCATISLSPTSLPAGTVNTAYNQVVTASPAGTYGYSVTSGSLPAGLSLNATTGAITGTPTTQGTSNFIITAISLGPCSGSQTYSIIINPPANTAPSITPVAIARQAGSPVSNSTIANVGDAEQAANTLSVTVNGGGSATVNGVTVSGIGVSAAGVVTANVIAACGAFPANFTLRLTDGGGLFAEATLMVSVSGNTGPVLSYNNQSVAAGGSLTVNPATGPSDNGSVTSIVLLSQGSYTGTVSVNNGTGVVSISGAKLGGTHTITIRATDNCGNAVTDASFTLTVNCQTINLSPTTVPNGLVGTGYNQTVTASGGTPGYSFSVIAGALPTGLGLATSGSLSGTPSVGGTFNFTIRATDANGCQGTQSYSATINTPPTISVVASSRQQGSPASNSTIANVSDADQAANTLTVTVNGSAASATVNGVTVSGLGVSAGGAVMANVVASCAATNASFTLAVTDSASASTNATLNVTVAANSAPALGYGNQAVTLGGSLNVMPGAASDNGSIANFAVQSVAPPLTTTPAVNSSGVVSITNADPPGAHTITIRATDNCGATTDASFTLTVSSGSMAGNLDPGFGNGGKVTTDLPGTQDLAYAMVIQPDGKIVLAGRTGNPGDNISGDFALARYNSDGTPDASFGSGGVVSTPIFGSGSDIAYALALQADGKLVAAGSSRNSTSIEQFALVRYNPNGTLDTGFGTGGKVITSRSTGGVARAVVIRPDGKIIIGGTYNQSSCCKNFVLGYFNSNGSLDTSFGTGGFIETDFSQDEAIQALVLQPDGKLVAVGHSGSLVTYFFALARYNGDGSLDVGFGTGGKVLTDISGGTIDQAYAAALQPEGKIVVAGYTSNNFGTASFALARYNGNGSPDAGFGAGGQLTTAFTGGSIAYGVAAQADGKIVAAGYTTNASTGYDFALARYNSNGSLDLTFGPNLSGKVTTDFFSVPTNSGGDRAYAVALQNDGKIVAAGYATSTNLVLGDEFALARYEGTTTCASPSINTQPANQTVTIGQSASFSVEATGTGLAYQWRKNSVNISGATASSFTINAAQLADAGSYDVVITGACGSATSQTATLTVNCQSITINPPAIPGATIGQFYSQSFTQAGGIGAVTFSLTGTLPPGLGFNAATATISGTPTQANTFNFSITATDANNCGITGGYQIVVAPCPAITIAPVTLPAGRAGDAYNQTLVASGTAGPYTFSITGGTLPSGMGLSSDGVLSGTPATFGTFNFTAKATDANGCMGTQNYGLTINPPCGAITIAPATLPGGFTITAYNQTLTASGGAAPYTFTVIVGALPNGVNLSASGVLSGTPNATGTFTFTVKATDNNACMGTQVYIMVVSSNGLQFFPLPSPVRLLDTRGGGISGCTTGMGPIAANATRTQPARTVCSGIPANATAVIGNITVVPSGPGFLTMFPSDSTQPTVANSNFTAGEVTNNFFTVGLGTDGAFKIFTSATTDVIIDVTGYYAPPAVGGLYYHPLPSPVRLVQTFPGQTGCFANPTVTQLHGTNDPNANPALDLMVDGRGAGLPSPCNSIPNDAVVLVGNATTVFPNAPFGFGYLTIYPSDAARPTVASSNYGNNDIINGPFAVKLGADGKFKVYTFSTTHLVIDISGYYSASANDVNGTGLLFNPLPKPMRLLETRNIPGFPLTGCYQPQAPIPGGVGGIRTQQVWGTCADQPITIPNAARAVAGNVTAINPVNAGFGTFFPGNVGTAPTVATTNYPFPVVFGYNRHYYVGLGPVDGTFKILTQFTSDYIVDVSGYFAP